MQQGCVGMCASCCCMQYTRMAVLDGFRGGQHHVLVATDVAARGLDINDLGACSNRCGSTRTGHQVSWQPYTSCFLATLPGAKEASVFPLNEAAALSLVRDWVLRRKIVLGLEVDLLCPCATPHLLTSL
eukprot:1160202-Pelagomonas_calceolata.AAC.7